MILSQKGFRKLICFVKFNGSCTPKHPFILLGMMASLNFIRARFIQIFRKSDPIFEKQQKSNIL